MGGSEAYCHQLSRRLAERGHEVTVLTSRYDMNGMVKEKIDGFEVLRQPCLGVIWGMNPATLILNKLLTSRFDIVHAHSYIFFTSNQAALARRLRRAHFLLHLHGGLDAQPSSGDFATRFKFHVKKMLYDRTVGRWTARSADAVASVCKRDIDVASKLWRLDRNKVHWAPNAIDLSMFNGTNHTNGPNVAFIGRLEPWKGIRTLVEVAKLVRDKREDVEFVIVGDGSLRDYVRGCPSLRKARFLGQIPNSMVPRVLAESAVLVLPSYVEGLPTVCLEALASSVPVVASGVGGTSEVVKDGETGYLFEPGNATMCAERILRLLSDDRLRRRMGECGRRLVSEEYGWERVIGRIERIYEVMDGTTT